RHAGDEEKGEIVFTLIRLGEFERAEEIYWSSDSVGIAPERLVEAAMSAGNTRKALEYAKLGQGDQLAYSEALDKLVTGLIGPLYRLAPRAPAKGGPYRAWLMSLPLILMPLAPLWRDTIRQMDVFATLFDATNAGRLVNTAQSSRSA